MEKAYFTNLCKFADRNTSLMTGKWFKLGKRFIEFSASSLLGTIVDTFVLWVCSKWLFSTYVGEYIISPAISFECAAVTNFVVAYFLIWKDRVSRRTARSFFRHLGGYNLSCVGAFLVKMAFLLLIQKCSSGMSCGVTCWRCACPVA